MSVTDNNRISSLIVPSSPKEDVMFLPRLSRLLRPNFAYTIIFTLFFVSAISISAQVPFRIEIENLQNVPRGGEIAVPVSKIQGSDSMRGFTFGLVYDMSELTLLDIEPGEIFDIPGGFEWEDFSFQQESYTYPIYDPLRPPPIQYFYRVSATADLDNGNHHPAQLFILDGTVLFTLRFRVTNNIAYACNAVPIRFFWTDCSDNTISYGDAVENLTAISDRVLETYEGNEYDIAAPWESLPSYGGAPNACLDSVQPGNPLPNRFIDLYNSFMEIECDTTNPDRGDVNLNGLRYELADLTLFSQYFLDGLSAFTISVENQINASDINGDRRPLSMPDFVNMTRIEEGEMAPDLPVHNSIWGMINITGALNVMTIGFAFGGPVGGIQLCFDAKNISSYSIQLLPHAGQMDLLYKLKDDTLKILIYHDLSSVNLAGAIDSEYGEVVKISYAGTEPRLVSFSAAGYYGEEVISQWDDILSRGDINLNGIGYEIADAVVFANYFIYGLSAFTVDAVAQILATDINMDFRPLTLEDYTLLSRIIEGRMSIGQVIDPDFEGSLTFSYTDSSIIAGCDFEKPVGGLILVYYAPGLMNYSVRSSPNLSEIEPWPFYENDTLRILSLGSFEYPDSTIIAADSGLMEIVYAGNRPTLVRVEAGGFYGEGVNISLIAADNKPPIFQPYPAEMTNSQSGGFYYDFNAVDQNEYPDSIEYTIISGPGTINQATGIWVYAPLCDPIGSTLTLEICASDVFHPCPQSNKSLHAIVHLSITNPLPLLGDMNGDGTIQLGDIVFLINFLYRNGSRPLIGLEVADADASGRINLLDATYLTRYLYMDGPAAKPLCQ